MREYAKSQIAENYGEEALIKIEKFVAEHTVNTLIVYSEPEYDTFEIVGGILTNHSITVDEALELINVDMDKFADEQGWDGWDYGALEFVDVE